MKRTRIKKIHKTLVVLFVLCGVGCLASSYFDTKPTTTALLEAGWGGHVNTPSDNDFAFTFTCLGHGECRPVWWNRFKEGDLFLLTQGLLVGFGVFMLLALILKPFANAGPEEKDPGGGNFATDEELKAYLNDSKDSTNPRRGHYGYTESGKQLRAPLRDRCTHLAIFAGTGGGKTTRIIKPSLIQDALDGTSVLMVDPKWPDPRSGYSDLLAIFKAQGYEVQVFCPFEENTLRLPLIGSLKSHADADVLAATIMPKATGDQGEGSTFYRNQERELLKHLLWGEAQAGRDSMGGVYDLLDGGPKAIKLWVDACKDPKIDKSMTTLLELRRETLIGLLQGLKGTLNIFTNERLDAATQAGRYGWQNLSPTSLTRRKSVLYVGIPQQMFLRGEGKLLLNLFFRRIMDELLSVAEQEGGSLKRHLAVYIDEFAHVGRLEDAGSWFGTMRSYNIAFTVALQNRAQLEMVYGTVGARAMEGGNFQHLITFPSSLRGDDKDYVSKLLGEVTAEEVIKSKSWQNIFEPARRTETRRKVARPLLSREEMDKWDSDYGVLVPHGAAPTKIAAPMIHQKRVGRARNRFYMYRNAIGMGNSSALVESLLAHHRLEWLHDNPPKPGTKTVPDSEMDGGQGAYVFTEPPKEPRPTQPKSAEGKVTVAKAEKTPDPPAVQVVSAGDEQAPAPVKKASPRKPPKKSARQAPANATKLHLVPNGELMPSFRAWVESLAWRNVPLTVYRVREGGRDRISKVLFDQLPGALRHEYLEHWKQRNWLRVHRGKLGIINNGCTVLCPVQIEAFIASPKAQVVEIGEGNERVVVKARADEAHVLKVQERGEKRDEAVPTTEVATASQPGSSDLTSTDDPGVQAALGAWIANHGFQLVGHPKYEHLGRTLNLPNERLLGRYEPETFYVLESYLESLAGLPSQLISRFASVKQSVDGKNLSTRAIPGALARRILPLRRLLTDDAVLLESHPTRDEAVQAVGKYDWAKIKARRQLLAEVTGISLELLKIEVGKLGSGRKSVRYVTIRLHPEPLTAPTS